MRCFILLRESCVRGQTRLLGRAMVRRWANATLYCLEPKPEDVDQLQDDLVLAVGCGSFLPLDPSSYSRHRCAACRRSA